jgi:hypothetical protein
MIHNKKLKYKRFWAWSLSRSRSGSESLYWSKSMSGSWSMHWSKSGFNTQAQSTSGGQP